MSDAQTVPYQYQPGQVAEQLPAIRMAAEQLGLLEDAAFDASGDASFVSGIIRSHFPECSFETRPPGKEMRPTVISFESLVNDEHRLKQSSGIRLIAGRPTVWVEEMERRVNLVSVLRETGAMIEMETGRLLGMMKGQSELVITSNKKTYSFAREVTPGYYLSSAGFVSQDATREYINSHAAVLQSLALALLLKLDPRLVFLDVFERAREDPLMFSILCALSTRSGIDFTDRKELASYVSEYYELITGEDVHYPNLQQVNCLAAYFGKHLRLNLRHSASGR